MEEINNSVSAGNDESSKLNSNFVDLHGNEKTLMDMDDFETLDISSDIRSGILNNPTVRYDSSENVGDNAQASSGLMSTTRPLVTPTEEDLACYENLFSSNIHYDSTDLSDKVNTNEKAPLLDVKAAHCDQSSSDTQQSEQQHSSEAVSIKLESHDKLDSETTRSAANESDNATVTFEKVYGTEVEELLPNLKDPKIDTKLGAGFVKPNESGFRACESIAQPAVEESEVAMEAESTASVTKADADGCPFSPGVWFNPEKLHPCVAEYVYWRDTKKTGIVFGSSLVLLLSLTYFSLISVVAYIALAALSITISFRIYKNILQAVQKSNEGHPFRDYLEIDINLPSDKVQEVTETLVHHVNCTTNKLRSLFLVEDLIDSLKLGVLLWCLTYVGAWFNGMTLIILALVSVFTLPKVYEINKAQIDHYLDLIRVQVKETIGKINAKIPLGKKKKEQ